jgi:hypothetical protein
MQEEFKIIKDFENYSISNFGNVKNNKTGKILKPGNCCGYHIVSLNGKSQRVNRLVAQSFIPNPDNKPNADHIDNNKKNNNVNNLRWATQSENCSNMSIGNRNTSGIKGVHFDKLRNKWVAEIKHEGIKYYLGRFENIEDAIKARQLKSNVLQGDYVNKCEKIINLNIKIPQN